MNQMLNDDDLVSALISSKDELHTQFPSSEVKLRIDGDPDGGDMRIVIEPQYSGSVEEALEKYPHLFRLYDGWSERIQSAIAFSVEYV
jgi:hypothetical protein